MTDPRDPDFQNDDAPDQQDTDFPLPDSGSGGVDDWAGADESDPPFTDDLPAADEIVLKEDPAGRSPGAGFDDDAFADDAGTEDAENPFDLGDDSLGDDGAADRPAPLVPPEDDPEDFEEPDDDPEDFGEDFEDAAEEEAFPAETEPDAGETYTLGEATVPPKWGGGLNPPPAEREPPPARSAPAPAVVKQAPAAKRAVARPAEDGEEEEEEDAPSRRRAGVGGPAKPKLRDWLEARCKKEAQMYALGAAVIAPVAFLAVSLTWGLLYVLAPGEGLVAAAFATLIVAALFWVNGKSGDARTLRVHVEPGDREIEPVTIDVPRGSGMTWLMYLTGSRDLPGFVNFIAAITLFGPRLCDLAIQMGRTAKLLWMIDADALAGPLKTLVKAQGKVSFAAFFEAHRAMSPQGLVRRLGRVDGVLFLPTSEPPGLCVSNALKDEFAAWRGRWQRERAGAGDDRLYD